MRLLNTETKTLETFDIRPREYAILSHRWLEGELEFRHVSSSDVDVTQMKGYAKLSSACDTARRLGFKYLWMDTCCIDKSSSSELSESINSMYEWYQEALLCIVFLNDVRKDRWRSQLAGAEWFTRGWTLQELIAPLEAIFVAEDWESIGTKSSLARQIANITGIDEHVLLTGNMDGISIARKMSWVASRKTTRPEDLAYSLLGIFGVNMPTIYGEGNRAFIRLQEEIMRNSTDQSIFAWCKPSGTIASYPVRLEEHSKISNIGLLAEHPRDFEWGKDVVQIPFSALDNILHVRNLDGEWTKTNRGVRMRLPLQQMNEDRNIRIAFLACGNRGGPTVFAIFLRQVSSDQFTRIRIKQSDTSDVYFAEVPLDVAKVSSVSTTVVSIVSHISQSTYTHRRTTHSVSINLTELQEHLRQWKLELCDRSWNEELHEHDRFLHYYVRAWHPYPTGHEMFVFAKDESQTVQFMLVVTLNVNALEVGAQPTPRIDIRVITVRPDGGIPSSMLTGGPHNAPRRPHEVYEAWRRSAPPLDLSEPPQFPVVKLSVGVEIGFAVVSKRSSGSWRIWAIPSTSSSQDILGLSPQS